MGARTDFVHFQQFQPAAVQQLNGVLTIEALIQFYVTTVERVEVLIHTAKRY